MKTSEAFPSQWLAGTDLSGKTLKVTISKVEIEEVGEDREPKLVISFAGKSKRLICNKTNSSSIEEQYGNETDDWVGKTIDLWTQPVAFKGKTTLAIRVKPPAGPVIPASAIDGSDDDVEF